MADPIKYIPGYSYSGYQTANPTDPLPAPEVDNDLAEISNSIGTIVDAVKNVRRSDGALKNGIVTIDSLSTDVKALLGENDYLDTVGQNIAEIVTVADNITGVNTVAANIGNVNLVGASIVKVNDVSANMDDVVAVANDIANIDIVAGNIADVNNFADVYQGAKATAPTTRNDGSALRAGDLYFDTTLDTMRVYGTTGEWRDATSLALNMVPDSFTGDGATKDFTLSAPAGVAANVLVWVGGVRQVPGDDYTVADMVLTLLTAPDDGVDVDTLVVATVSTLNAPADGSVTADTVSDDPDEQAAIFEKIKQPVTLADMADDAKADLRLVDPNGPRDMLVWSSGQTVSVFGSSFAMGGFRRFGRYEIDRAPVFPAPVSPYYPPDLAVQNTISMETDLAHGMTAPTYENWYAAFAVANDGDAAASFEISPFLYVKSVDGSVVSLGKCGEVTDVNTIDDATYAWTDGALVGTKVLVISEMFSTTAWTMRVTTVTANTAGTITLDEIGTVDTGSMLLLAPSGWDHCRYLSTFYYDTAEVRNMFDGGGGPVRCRMGGVDVVKAHGNDGTNSTYLDGPVATASKKIDFSRFVAPLATGIYLQSNFLIASSDTNQFASIYFDMDGSIHTPESHDYVKAGTYQSAPSKTIFLTFKGSQTCRPSTNGADQNLIRRVSMVCTGWFEP